MSKIISYSNWNAKNIPHGISFDAASGVFYGSPNVEAGEYIVPVSVQTNYGSDTNNVRFKVKKPEFGVFAKGANAQVWSENNPEDVNGFRKLNIPDCSKINSLAGGFAAKTPDGKWFLAHNAYNGSNFNGHNFDVFGNTGLDYNTPKLYPIDNITNMMGGAIFPYSLMYFMYSSDNGSMFYTYTPSSPMISKSITLDIASVNLRDVKFTQNNFSHGIAWVTNDNHVTNGSSIYEYIEQPVIKIVPLSQSTRYKDDDSSIGSLLYINNSSELFEIFEDKQGNHISEHLLPDAGKIINIWTILDQRKAYALNEHNELYIRGCFTAASAGNGASSVNYKTFTKIGTYDVKKIEGPFMLTRDGQLYHSSTSSIYGITGSHSRYTEIFSDYYVHDFSYVPNYQYIYGTGTLVILKEDR